MLASGQSGYKSAGGVHAYDTRLLDKAVQTQIDYANNYQNSGAIVDTRTAMYPREAHHIGRMVGVQQALKEKGAKSWRRVLHPELSKTGPCAECTADALVTHDITEPWYEYHPLGRCGIQGVAFISDSGATEIPHQNETEHDYFAYVKRLLGKMVSVIRRFRR